MYIYSRGRRGGHVREISRKGKDRLQNPLLSRTEFASSSGTPAINVENRDAKSLSALNNKESEGHGKSNGNIITKEGILTILSI